MNSGIRTVRIEQIKESVMKKAFLGLVTALSFGVVIAAVGCVANPASAVDEQVVETVEASVANVSAPHPAEVEGSQGSVIVPDYTAAQRLHPMAAERSAGQGTRSAIVVGTSQPIAIPGLAEAAAWQRIKAVAGSFPACRGRGTSPQDPGDGQGADRPKRAPSSSCRDRSRPRSGS